MSDERKGKDSNAALRAAATVDLAGLSRLTAEAMRGVVECATVAAMLASRPLPAPPKIDLALSRERLAEMGATLLVLSLAPDADRAAAMRALQGHDPALLEDVRGCARAVVELVRVNFNATPVNHAAAGVEELETIA